MPVPVRLRPALSATLNLMAANHYHNGIAPPVLVDGRGQPLRRDGSASQAGGMALPFAWTFIARYNGGGNSFWHDRFDEALRQSRDYAESMRRDCALSAIVEERRLAITALPWHLEVPDEQDPQQMRVKDGMTRLVKGIPSLRRILYWLTDAIWYGKQGVQLQWEWCEFHDRQPDSAKGSPPGGSPKKPAGALRRGLTVAQAWPVMGDKIGHQEDHTPYILVNPAEAGRLGPSAETIPTSIGGWGLLLRGSWRVRA